MSDNHENKPQQTSGTVTAEIAFNDDPALLFNSDSDSLQMVLNGQHLIFSARQTTDLQNARGLYIEVPELNIDGKVHTYEVAQGTANGHCLRLVNSTYIIYNLTEGKITVALDDKNRLQGSFSLEGIHSASDTVALTEGTIDLKGFVAANKPAGTGTFKGKMTGGPADGAFNSSSVRLELKEGGPIPPFRLIQGTFKDPALPHLDHSLSILVDKDHTDLVNDLADNLNIWVQFLNSRDGVFSSTGGTLTFTHVADDNKASGKIENCTVENGPSSFIINATFDVSAT